MENKQLSTKGVAALLSRSPHWVHMNAKRLGIPRYRLGGTWVYDEGQVLAWFESQKESSIVIRQSKSNSMEVFL
jgi:hypothetical protein